MAEAVVSEESVDCLVRSGRKGDWVAAAWKVATMGSESR